MLDIIEIPDGSDIVTEDTAVAKAGNVLSIQLGSLEYAPSFGVDLKYFLQSELQFQNESFKAYLIQRLTEHQVNVAQVIETVEALYEKYTFQINDNTAKGLMR